MINFKNFEMARGDRSMISKSLKNFWKSLKWGECKNFKIYHVKQDNNT